MIPASNNKVLTTAAAYLKFGGNSQLFTTNFHGIIDNGIMRELCVIGSGKIKKDKKIINKKHNLKLLFFFYFLKKGIQGKKKNSILQLIFEFFHSFLLSISTLDWTNAINNIIKENRINFFDGDLIFDDSIFIQKKKNSWVFFIFSLFFTHFYFICEKKVPQSWEWEDLDQGFTIV
jgi:hypothetical protein